MQLAARSGDARLVGFQIKVEVRERVALDVARGVAQRLELRKPLGREPPPFDETEALGERDVRIL